MRLTRSIAGFVNGIVMLEVAPSPAGMPNERAGEQRQWSEAVRALRRPALDGAFEYGLACMLDGIRLPTRRRR